MKISKMIEKTMESLENTLSRQTQLMMIQETRLNKPIQANESLEIQVQRQNLDAKMNL